MQGCAGSPQGSLEKPYKVEMRDEAHIGGLLEYYIYLYFFASFFLGDLPKVCASV